MSAQKMEQQGAPVEAERSFEAGKGGEDNREDSRKDLVKKCMTRFSIQNMPELLNEMAEFVTSPEVNPGLKDEETVFGKRHPKVLLTARKFRDCFNSAMPSSGIDGKGAFPAVQRKIAAGFKELVECHSFRVPVDFILALSGEMYESGEARGKSLVVFPLESIESAGGVLFEETARQLLVYPNVHAVRKQLNMCDRKTALAVARCDEREPWGNFVTVGLIPFHQKDENREGAFWTCPSFDFSGHMGWNFCVPGNKDTDTRRCLVRCVNGALMFPKLSLKEEFAEAAERVFGKGKAAQTVSRIVSKTEKSRGAVLIFANKEDIARECNRLARENDRGIALKTNCSLLEDDAEELLLKFSSIDGAVLVDTDGRCHAIGVILDGCAVKGSSARGARYNCTKSYIGSLQGRQSLGVVLSEDGMLDYFTSC